MLLTSWNYTLGITLRKLRIKNRLSQSCLASMLAISRNSYIEWENGHVDFTLSKIQKICCCYDIFLAELLKELPPAKYFLNN